MRFDQLCQCCDAAASVQRDIASFLKRRRKRQRITYRKSYLRKKEQRKAQEAIEMKKAVKQQRAATAARSAAAAVTAGWELVVKSQIKTGGKEYPRGSVIDPKVIGTGLQSMLDTHFLQWEPPGKANRPQPRELAPAALPKLKPTVLIVHSEDPIESYRLTRAALLRVVDGDAGMCEDLLMANAETRELFRRATQLMCQREAKRRNVVSVNPSECPL